MGVWFFTGHGNRGKVVAGANAKNAALAVRGLAGGLRPGQNAMVPRAPIEEGGNVTLYLQPFSMGGRMVPTRPSRAVVRCMLSPHPAHALLVVR